jgi:hypothetical protein
MELLPVTVMHLNVSKQAPACTIKETPMAAIVTSSHGKDNLPVLQLLGSKNDSIVTTMDLATMADLQLLHGQVAVVVAATTTAAATVVLLAVALHHGTNTHLRHRLRLLNLAMVTVAILAMTKVLVMDHLQRQLPRVSALSCNNMLVHLRLRRVTGLHHHRHPTMLLHPHRLPITLHLRRREWNYNSMARSRSEMG